MKSKIAILGGSGFVGSRLIKELSLGKCYNIDKNPSPFFNDITRIKNICDSDLHRQLDKDTSTVVLLAAEHRDDVSPTSLYYDVNVEGTKNVLSSMDQLGIRHIIFTSSVAVYGLNKVNPNEAHPADPFNHYGKSKWQAEEALRNWFQKDSENRSLIIVRPTVIFGERNRGNVFNLLKQIASGNFMLIGKGTNKKSMAYVGNIAAFLKHCISIEQPGYRIYNYIDKPDLDMNELVSLIKEQLGKGKRSIRIPYLIGMAGGYCFDFLAKITGKSLPISSVRVKKFCATTQFDSKLAHSSGFQPPYTLHEGLKKTLHFEFLSEAKDDITFESE